MNTIETINSYLNQTKESIKNSPTYMKLAFTLILAGFIATQLLDPSSAHALPQYGWSVLNNNCPEIDSAGMYGGSYLKLLTGVNQALILHTELNQDGAVLVSGNSCKQVEIESGRGLDPYMFTAQVNPQLLPNGKIRLETYNQATLRGGNEDTEPAFTQNCVLDLVNNNLSCEPSVYVPIDQRPPTMPPAYTSWRMLDSYFQNGEVMIYETPQQPPIATSTPLPTTLPVQIFKAALPMVQN
jgi:hypothetical protein